MKFKVGDRVRTIDAEPVAFEYRNITGRIMSIDYDFHKYYIKFDKYNAEKRSPESCLRLINSLAKEYR